MKVQRQPQQQVVPATTAASEDEKNTGTVKNETTEEGNTVEDFSQETTDTVTEE